MKLFEALANTQERREIRNSVRALCDRFDDRYWAEKDRLHEFPHEFADAAAKAGFKACDRAIRTHGGMGYAAEYHVERYFREMVATQLAPISREMILCIIAERELGLPKSY